MRELTPLHLQILIHYCVTPVEWPHMVGVNFEYHQDLEEWGLLTARPRKDSDPVPPDATSVSTILYVCTEKGRVHLQQLCSLPLPRQAWLNMNGEVIA